MIISHSLSFHDAHSELHHPNSINAFCIAEGTTPSIFVVAITRLSPHAYLHAPCFFYLFSFPYFTLCLPLSYFAIIPISLGFHVVDSTLFPSSLCVRPHFYCSPSQAIVRCCSVHSHSPNRPIPFPISYHSSPHTSFQQLSSAHIFTRVRSFGISFYVVGRDPID